MNKYMRYDFFGKEWLGICGACRKELFAPTRKQYVKSRLIHTRSVECLGGY